LFFCGCVVALVAASCGGLMATKLYTSAHRKPLGGIKPETLVEAFSVLLLC
jgi:hypothetical protein